ncbi:hypothetical protein K505DRAFT_330463 [Melanomma pulvis-pyrius CBS 109.77]|uniref:Uncharacterized protein n=1 Tax=Melanomma pulvis-pyrius CBS 109.77 TaxID=1314802 RepID=A0A6A6WQB4_9PLEO|nr:hypothetical protein K505DRAFT_330463 [Melanomma pulvis-pyrius CBS 109.77]
MTMRSIFCARTVSATILHLDHHVSSCSRQANNGIYSSLLGVHASARKSGFVFHFACRDRWQTEQIRTTAERPALRQVFLHLQSQSNNRPKLHIRSYSFYFSSIVVMSIPGTGMSLQIAELPASTIWTLDILATHFAGRGLLSSFPPTVPRMNSSYCWLSPTRGHCRGHDT